MQHIDIKLKDNQKLFFTSDLHFSHDNIIVFCNRPFKNSKEMKETLIENWNNTVSNNDIVFNLGDFSWFTARHDVKKLVDRLNGDKYFLLGNHDTIKMYELIDDEKFHLCQDIVTIHLYKGDIYYEIVLCHYPLVCYPHSIHKNVYQFFGHIHSLKDKPLTEFGKLLPLNSHQMDVGVDRWDYKPVEFNELISILS